MADMGSNSGDIFDHRKIRRLVQLMDEHDLSEIDLRQADTRLRIRRGPEQVAQVIETAGFAAPAPRPATPAVVPPEAAPPKLEDDSQFVLIRSPMIGTFYSSPKPDQPPFVKVGDRVSSSTTVCIVEAMKVFNEIPAEISGTIVAVLAENGDPVEWNQPLFKVDPSK